MLEKELWKPDNFKEYKTKKDAEMRVKMAESGRYNPPPRHPFLQFKWYENDEQNSRFMFIDIRYLHQFLALVYSFQNSLF